MNPQYSRDGSIFMFDQTTQTKWFLSLVEENRLGLAPEDQGVTLQFWYSFFSIHVLFCFVLYFSLNSNFLTSEINAPKWKEWVIRNESPRVTVGRSMSWYLETEEKKKQSFDGERFVFSNKFWEMRYLFKAHISSLALIFSLRMNTAFLVKKEKKDRKTKPLSL